jgi:uncharacterized delta-60 repeat protein
VGLETVSIEDPEDIDLRTMRFERDGRIDEEFGQGGTVISEPVIYDEPGKRAFPDLVKLLPSGAMFTVSAAEFNFVVSRFNVDGTLDSSWSGDGHVETRPGTDSEEGLLPRDIEIAADGRVVVAGTRFGRGYPHLPRLRRYTSDGRLDKSFDENGVVGVLGSGGAPALEDVVIQPDGKIVVAGAENHRPSRFRLDRITVDGQPDPTFSDDGTVRTNFFSSTREGARVVTLYPGTRLIVGGWATKQFAIARYRS